MRSGKFGGLEEMEEWKEIPGYPGYMASSEGRIWSDKLQRCIRTHPDIDGYMIATINCKSMKVHRLVANTFISNDTYKPTVNHKDGNKANNDVSNLEWSSYSEQALHKCRVLNKPPSSQWNKKPIRLTKGCESYVFDGFIDAERHYGLYDGCIRDCFRKNKSKTWRGYKIEIISDIQLESL